MTWETQHVCVLKGTWITTVSWQYKNRFHQNCLEEDQGDILVKINDSFLILWLTDQCFWVIKNLRIYAMICITAGVSFELWLRISFLFMQSVTDNHQQRNITFQLRFKILYENLDSLHAFSGKWHSSFLRQILITFQNELLKNQPGLSITYTSYRNFESYIEYLHIQLPKTYLVVDSKNIMNSAIGRGYKPPSFDCWSY